MASKICVPCDFGIKNMYDPFHGNVTIEFNDDSKIKVSSLILSWNSATFGVFFNELRLTNVEIKDFTKEAVILFLEGLYTGSLKLEKDSFRELYKLSVVFKTKWLTDRCTEFFYQLVENISNEFEDLCFVFNEALNAHKTLKNKDFMKMVVDRFSKIENISSIFVEQYLTEYFSLITSETLDNLLLICQEDYVPVLKSLKQHLTERDFDDTTRILLSNSKVVKCLADNLNICEEVCELLTIKSDNTTCDDLKIVTNLNLCVIRATKSLMKTLSKQVVPTKNIPNLFHNWNVFNELPDEEKIWKLSSMPNICYFMIVEFCYLNFFSSELREKILQNITQIFANKSLCKLPSTFVHGFFATDRLAKLPQSVISDDNTAVLVGTETTRVQLVTTSELYKFYFQHPAAPRCEKHTECGFMLKVTPCSKEEVGSFNIELVIEESEYPADIHCHSEVISAAHMYLVVEGYCSNGIWYNTCISWRGKPEYSEDRGGVVWGGALCNNYRARIVVYYDIRDKK